jgi:phage N-6-adenine-methyltransferase
MAGQLQYMAKSQVQFTKDNEYYTPKEFVSRFGVFDYDPATTKEKAEEFGILNYDTIETDGLTKDWTKYNRIWINPPFTRKHEFIEKAWRTYLLVKNEIYILFPIEFITTARFHKNLCAGKLFIPNGRINFESGLGKKGKSPAFGSVVMKLQDNWEIELIDIK